MKHRYLLHIVLACHTLITVITAALIFYLLYSGLVGLALRSHPLLWLALIWPALIGFQLLLNRGDCLFQSCAKALTGTSSGWSRDLYLFPESWARAIPLVFTPLYLAGAGLVVGRALFRS